MTDISRRDIEVGRIRVQFFVKRRIEQTPTQPLANAFAPTRVSTPEATAFDLVRYASRIGGIGRAVETLTPLLPLMGPAELKRMLEAENEPATAQRLGYMIETLLATENWPRSFMTGCRLDLVLCRWPRVCAVTAPVIKRWRVLNNSGELER